MSSKVLRDTLRRKMTADRRALAMALGCEDTTSAISEVANSAANVLLSRAGAVEMRIDGGGSRLKVADTLTESGEGVFVSGGGARRVKRGDALCFYGGQIYTRNEVVWLGGSPMCFQQSDPDFQEGVRATNLSYLLGASGGAVINGAPGVGVLGVDVKLSGPEENISMSHRGKDKVPSVGWDPRQTFRCMDALKEREADNNAGLCVDVATWENCIRNDDFLSMGSKINHPPTDKQVNVVGWPVRLNLDRGEDVVNMFAPCVFGIRMSQLGHGRVICSNDSVLFIAIRDIEVGEELYLDYKLMESAGGTPSWYTEADAL